MNGREEIKIGFIIPASWDRGGILSEEPQPFLVLPVRFSPSWAKSTVSMLCSIGIRRFNVDGFRGVRVVTRVIRNQESC